MSGQDFHYKSELFDKVLKTIPFASASVLCYFRFSAYLYKRAETDYWGVPEEFIKIDYSSFFYQATIAIALTVLLMSFVYLFYNKYKEYKPIKKVSYAIGYSLILCIINFLFIIITLHNETGTSLLEILNQFIAILLVTLAYYCVEMIFLIPICLFFYAVFKQPIKDDKNEKQQFVSHIILLFVVLVLSSASLYFINIPNTNNTKKFDTIIYNESSYVILYRDDSRYFIRKCSFVGDEGIKINMNHYSIIDSKDTNVITKDFSKSNSKPVFSKEFW